MSAVYEDMVKIGQEGGEEALALMAALMEKNNRDAAYAFQTLYEFEKQESAFWKARCAELEGRLARAQERIEDIFIPQ